MKNWTRIEKKSFERCSWIKIEKQEIIWETESRKRNVAGLGTQWVTSVYQSKSWGPSCHLPSDFPVQSTKAAFIGEITRQMQSLLMQSSWPYFSFSNKGYNYITSGFRRKIMNHLQGHTRDEAKNSSSSIKDSKIK